MTAGANIGALRSGPSGRRLIRGQEVAHAASAILGSHDSADALKSDRVSSPAVLDAIDRVDALGSAYAHAVQRVLVRGKLTAELLIHPSTPRARGRRS
jgi:hypothetical protein